MILIARACDGTCSDILDPSSQQTSKNTTLNFPHRMFWRALRRRPSCSPDWLRRVATPSALAAAAFAFPVRPRTGASRAALPRSSIRAGLPRVPLANLQQAGVPERPHSQPQQHLMRASSLLAWHVDMPTFELLDAQNPLDPPTATFGRVLVNMTS